ncbi:MAG: alpha/beta fold hydrolase [Candidatus Rokuibacteriota bacterium]
MPELRLRGGPLDGLGLHYLVQGRGPVVALVHGLGGFAASWGPTMEALAGRATVLALDLPGFGRSAKPRVRYGLELFARALDGFLDAMGVGQVGLVGHSLGASVVLTYALAHPDRVDRVAFVGGLVPGFPYRPSPVYRALALPGVGEALALCGCAAVYRAALARCFHRPRADEIEFLVTCDYATRTGWGARAAYLSTVRAVREDCHMRGPEYRRVLRGVTTPVLLIHGRQDPVVPAAHCQEVARGLPRAETRWVDACGHFPQLEHPDPVNGWLSQFLVARPAPR